MSKASGSYREMQIQLGEARFDRNHSRIHNKIEENANCGALSRLPINDEVEVFGQIFESVHCFQTNSEIIDATSRKKNKIMR